MKNIVVIDQKNQLCLKDIQALEASLNLSLPLDYKNFLLLYNGGHPEKNIFPLIDTNLDLDGEVAWFLAYDNGKSSKLITIYARFKDRIPKGFIPIARNSFGDLICLCIDGNECGKLYFWDHNWEADDEQKVTFDNMYLIANNFIDFINSLYKLNIINDVNNNEVWIYSYDKYSLPFSTEAKKHGSIVTDFFAQAPIEVEDYIIERVKEANGLTLKYEVKPENKRYIRRINKAGEIVEEKTEEMK